MVNGLYNTAGIFKSNNMKDKHKTDVLFMYDKDGSDIYAYFPSEESDLNGNKTAYAHIGQHMGCSSQYVKECRRASPEAYNDLKNELESLGYNLNVLNNGI